MRLVPPVHADQVGGECFELVRISESAGVDPADTGDGSRERLNQVGGLAVVTDHEYIGFEELYGCVLKQRGAEVVERADDPRTREVAPQLAGQRSLPPPAARRHRACRSRAD